MRGRRTGRGHAAGAVAVALLLLAGAGEGAAADRVAAPGYRVETVVSDLPYALDAIELFRGDLLVSAGAPSPGGRLLRYGLRGNRAGPLPARSGEAVLWSRTRLAPLVTYRLTGRAHAGLAEAGRVVQLSQQWESDDLIVGLSALHDFAFRPDGRLLIADGARVLETPIYVTPPADAASLATVHRCARVCHGVAVSPADEVYVLEDDGEGGRVVRLDAAGGPRVLASGLPRPGSGLRLGRGGDLFLTGAAGVLRIRPDGAVVSMLAGVGQEARVGLDGDGQPLVADPVGGEVLRIRLPAP